MFLSKYSMASSLFVGLMSLCPLSLGASQAIPFSEAVELALTSHPQMAISHAQIEAANALTQESRGEFFPRLAMEAQAARSNNPLNVFSYRLAQGNVTFADFGLAEYSGPSSMNTQPSALNSPGYYNNFNTGFVMSMPIFTGGYNKAMLDKSHSVLNQAKHQDKATRNALIYEVLQAYEGVLLSQKFVDIAEKSVKSAQKILEMTQSLQKQSLTNESDHLIAQTNLRNAQTNLLAHKAEYATQLEAFRVLIGKPDSDLIPKESAAIKPPQNSIASLEERAILHNPQVHSQKSRIEAARAAVKAQNAAYWPQIDLKLKQEWNDENFGLSTPAGSIFVDFDWALFDFGIRSGASKKAEAEHKFAQGELNQQLIDIRLAMSDAVHKGRTAEAQLAASRDNRKASAKALEILKERYGRGAALLTQVLDTQSRHDTIKAQEAVAQYDIQLASARVLQLTNEIEQHHESTP